MSIIRKREGGDGQVQVSEEKKRIWDALHTQACKENKEFYVDPDSGMLVTTAVAHHKRGHCCKSGCRHCPYGFVIKS